MLDEFWEEKKGWKGEEEESDSDQEQDEEGGEEIQESEREGFESVDEERELEIIGRGLGLHRGVTVSTYLSSKEFNLLDESELFVKE